MSNLLPTPQGKDLATICADHTRRVQDLCVRFWHGDIDMWHYRKQSRELTQQFVNELQMLFNQSPASSNYPSSDTGLNQNIVQRRKH